MSDKPVLNYQEVSVEKVRRPKWVLAVVVVYLLLLLAALASPPLMAIFGGSDDQDRVNITLWMGGGVALLMMCGLSLIIVPVRVKSRRPVSRSHVIWPILGSGLMLGVLVFGAGIAIAEWGKFEEDTFVWIAIASSVITWLIWSVVFIAITWSKEAESFGMTLYKKVVAGSVLELLVAIPAHIVVRQRSDCCAGLWTAMGICLGVAVMLIALGPAVLLLYWRRIQKITPTT